jgi:hypothetical protein
MKPVIYSWSNGGAEPAKFGDPATASISYRPGIRPDKQGRLFSFQQYFTTWNKEVKIT